MNIKKDVLALSLFSGGLDSILASRVVVAQGIKVLGIKFVSPFFDYDLLQDPEAYQKRIKKLYDIDVIIKDISREYLELLHNPSHGFGKNFNPCIDCKILMVQQAKKMMEEMGASFIISGEVLGQRPMSQRRDTLNVIERDSGTRSYLLRPLSAKLMNETEAEKQGLVDRGKLLNFSGRGRSRQIALAEEFGITEFPAPAGGCRLTDKNLAVRIAGVYKGEFVIPAGDMKPSDILCLMTGRQFLLPGGGWLCLGRDEKDNILLERLKKDNDLLICMEDHPGPTALLKNVDTLYEDSKSLKQDKLIAQSLVVRYAKKVEGIHKPQVIELHYQDSVEKILQNPIAHENFLQWVI